MTSDVSERVARIEEIQLTLREKIDTHAQSIMDLELNISNLVDEVRRVRNALYFVVIALVANFPVLQKLLPPLLHGLQ